MEKISRKVVIVGSDMLRFVYYRWSAWPKYNSSVFWSPEWWLQLLLHSSFYIFFRAGSYAKLQVSCHDADTTCSQNSSLAAATNQTLVSSRLSQKQHNKTSSFANNYRRASQIGGGAMANLVKFKTTPPYGVTLPIPECDELRVHLMPKLKAADDEAKRTKLQTSTSRSVRRGTSNALAWPGPSMT